MFNLFDNFSKVAYNGSPAINILTSIRFKEIVKKNQATYYPYTVAEGERPDIIAANYYDDPRYSWVIYLANDIIDPYFDWPLSTDEFNAFIVGKYGSIEESMEKILYYVVAYEDDDSMLSVAAYEALPAVLKKYWQPIHGINNTVVSYERKELICAVETNKTIYIDVANAGIFTVGGKIKQSNSTLTSTGTISSIENNVLSVQHVEGSFNTTDNIYLYNTPSAYTTASSITDEIYDHDGNLINVSITNLELPYWKQVSAYEYEYNLNESKKQINLIDKFYIDQIEKELASVL